MFCLEELEWKTENRHKAPGERTGAVLSTLAAPLAVPAGTRRGFFFFAFLYLKCKLTLKIMRHVYLVPTSVNSQQNLYGSTRLQELSNPHGGNVRPSVSLLDGPADGSDGMAEAFTPKHISAWKSVLLPVLPTKGP